MMLSKSLAIFALLHAVGANFVSTWRFNRCPEGCECSIRRSDEFDAHLRVVDCSSRGLERFPPAESIPSDVQLLLLNDNRIGAIDDAQLRLWLPDLLVLDLKNNSIERIVSNIGLFEGVFNVRRLDLSHNKLSNLKHNIFEGLFNLESLDLSANSLGTIEKSVFHGLAKLKKLDLSSNQLSYVQRDWWQHVSTLYGVNLGNNRLSLIQGHAFRPLRQLLTLNLSQNRIFKLNRNAFFGLRRLENLRLNGNALHAVPRSALQSVKDSLRSLHMDRNPIFKLNSGDVSDFPRLRDVSLSGMARLRLSEPRSFSNLPALLVLQLHDNPFLTFLDAETFSEAPNLAALWLHNNNLTVLEKETVESLPALRRLSFYGNPLSCDCNSRWLKQLIEHEHKTIVFEEHERMVCNYPAEHKFKLFKSLSASQLPSRCAPRLIYTFAAADTRQTGGQIVYDCRAVGIPRPQLMWVGPSGRLLDQWRPKQVPHSFLRRKRTNKGRTLTIRQLKPKDSGRYTCIAQSSEGSAVAQSDLSVSSLGIRLSVTAVSPNSAELRWSAPSRPRRFLRVLLRRLDKFESAALQYSSSVVGPSNHVYQLANLESQVPYEACLALDEERPNGELVAPISCARFVTRKSTAELGRRAGNVGGRGDGLLIGVALGLVAALIIVLALVLFTLKKAASGPRLELDRQCCCCEDSVGSADSKESLLDGARDSVERDFPPADVYAPLVVTVLS